jgi:dihydropyrimidinase
VRVCIHAEDGATIERNIAAALVEGRTGPEAIPDVRPPSVEAEAIQRAAALAREAGAWLYVVHLSSEEGLRAVLDARAGGTDVHAETCPQYLYLDEQRFRNGEQDFVCAPPIRARMNRDALWSAMGAGDVEVFATDHCPFTKEDRRRGTTGTGWENFTQIPGGLPGVETRVSLLYQGVREGRLSLERWVDAIAAAPARMFGLDHRKGAVRERLDADLVVFDPEATKRLDASGLHSRTDHSPYEAIATIGWPALTVSRGRVVARNGEPADVEPGHGRFVPRTPRAR